MCEQSIEYTSHRARLTTTGPNPATLSLVSCNESNVFPNCPKVFFIISSSSRT